MRRSPFRTATAALVLALAGLASTQAVAAPQGTAFTYQGLLESGGMPVTDFVDIRFTLWDAETGGASLGQFDVASIQPDDGVFSVDIDFGTSPFSTNEARWLQIEVSPAEMNMYDNLGRVPLRATMYSLSTRGIEVRNDGQVVIGEEAVETPDDAIRVGSVGTPANRFLRLDTGGGSAYSSGIKFRHFNNNIGFDIVSSDTALRGLNFIDATNGSFSRLFIERDTGLIGMGTTDPQSQLHLNEPGFVVNAGAFANNTDLAITSNDAMLDVTSNSGGSIGSILSLKQVDLSGNLEDNWSFLIETAGGMDIRYGTNSNGGANATVMSFDEDGSVGVGDPSHDGRFDVAYNANTFDVGIDVEGISTGAISIGVSSSQAQGRAVFGETTATTGTNFGVYGSVNALNATGWGVFSNGRLGASGTKSFCIDHPLDPAGAYLLHYSSESPEPLNTYSGNATLDGNGAAVVQLPAYFESINTDVRYTLTPVGAPMPNLYVAQKVQNNAFVIAGGAPRMEVSWQVTATRNDAYVRTMGAPVEVQKSPEERGRYLMPELYGLTDDAAIDKRPAPGN